MDQKIRGTQAQALIDSLRELVATGREVDDVITTAPSNNVMVPLSPVAYMSGVISGSNILMSLGQDYYVERTQQQTKAILQRRIEGMSYCPRTSLDILSFLLCWRTPR